MKKTLAPREKILLIILLILVLIAGYFKLFFQPVNARLSQAQDRLTLAEDTLANSQIRLNQMQRMEKELQDLQVSPGYRWAPIPQYNNIENVMIQLGAILGSTANYKLTFSDVSFEDNLAVRPIQMVFTSSNYAAAKKTLTDLYDCPFRCILSNITVTNGSDTSGTVTAQRVTVSATITFYEKNTQETVTEEDGSKEEGDREATGFETTVGELAKIN